MKPDASPEEVKAVVNDDQGGQIFSQAVSVPCFIHVVNAIDSHILIVDELQPLWRSSISVP